LASGSLRFSITVSFVRFDEGFGLANLSQIRVTPGTRTSAPSLPFGEASNATAVVDVGCFFTYFPGRSSKKWIQMIDDKQRPIDSGGGHLASKTSHFQGYFQRLSRIKATESSRLMERAMGIEPTSEAWEVLEFTVRVISRTVLCGGRSAMVVSTATHERSGRCIRPGLACGLAWPVRRLFLSRRA